MMMTTATKPLTQLSDHWSLSSLSFPAKKLTLFRFLTNLPPLRKLLSCPELKWSLFLGLGPQTKFLQSWHPPCSQTSLSHVHFPLRWQPCPFDFISSVPKTTVYNIEDARFARWMNGFVKHWYQNPRCSCYGEFLIINIEPFMSFHHILFSDHKLSCTYLLVYSICTFCFPCTGSGDRINTNSSIAFAF